MPTSRSNGDPDEPSETKSFGLLHDDVKRWVWNQQGWTSLRPIQEEAIPIILKGQADVILSSPTAAGKTEAAFLPIISRVAEERQTGEPPGGGFDVVYISPLKALINDQFERLESLCAECDIPVHRRHGDVSSSRKRKALEDPEGVLLITPESVEALFIHRPGLFQQALQGLSYIVVDEVHSFIGEPRGKQLQSLLHRIEYACDEWIPRVALSATIGDLEICAEFLRPRASKDVEIVDPDQDGQGLKLLVKGYEEDSKITSIEEDEESGSEIDIAEHIFSHLRGQDNLVFTNRRSDVELYTDLLKQLSEEAGVPNEFQAHHGSLSKEIRETSEEALKSGRPATVVCTSTLELGIDIGDMQSIAQVGSPPSVSSMRQRLGRSGREDNAAALRVYIQEPEITESTSILDTIRPELVQTIAMVDLLLDSWYEPPRLNALELSTLIQQLLSIIAQNGGIQVQTAFKNLCQTGAFGAVSSSQFESLLEALADQDVLTQAGDGDLIMGLKGERLIRHYDFYSAFWSPDEYRLVADETTLGTLPLTSPLIEGQYMIFGGGRWEVLEIDEEKNVVYLKPAKGGRVPRFGGEGPIVHDEVRQKMYSTYTGSSIPKYLDSSAVDLLKEGRRHFDRYELSDNHMLHQGKSTVLFIWAGDNLVNTVHVLLTRNGFQASKNGMALHVNECTPNELTETLSKIVSSEPPEPSELADVVENKILDKHDRFLPNNLLCENYASKRLDVQDAIHRIEEIIQ